MLGENSGNKMRPSLEWPLLTAAIVTGVIVVPSVGYGFFRVANTGRIFPNTFIGEVDVSRLKPEVARAKLTSRAESLQNPGISVELGTNGESRKDNVPVQMEVSIDEAVARAYQHGRAGGVIGLSKGFLTVFTGYNSKPEVQLDRAPLEVAVENLARRVDDSARDVRLHIDGGRVEILTDTKTGKVLAQESLVEDLMLSGMNLSARPIRGRFITKEPTADPTTAASAKAEAERMITPITLSDRGETYPVSATTVGDWLVSDVQGTAVVVEVDHQKLDEFVASLALEVNEPATNLGVKVADGKVIEFIPPKPGRVVDEDTLVEDLLALLEARRKNEEPSRTLALSVIIDEAEVEGNANELGIEELIGRATTTLTGSPKNRILNIKNGVRILSGHIIKPGEEFSTIGTLGEIDNTTGYLPELVIKGDRTVPEFGGGLCQVSTTLFRAVMNSALPITARRNHSYRVVYYEKDGEGNYIGPGLDATIYDPNPDFKFRNNTGASILLTGYVIGDRITFELYGKKDGRTANIKGPTLLSSTPPGEPIYIETDEIPVGETRQIERPHAGGSAVATYTINYPDGTEDVSVYESTYRPWPAQYLVGVEPIPEGEVPTDPLTQNPDIPPTPEVPVIL